MNFRKIIRFQRNIKRGTREINNYIKSYFKETDPFLFLFFPSAAGIIIFSFVYKLKKSNDLTTKIGNDPDKYFTKLLENQFLGIKNQNHIIVLNSAKGHLFIIFRIQQH